jgi:hypothetical protein
MDAASEVFGSFLSAPQIPNRIAKRFPTVT